MMSDPTAAARKRRQRRKEHEAGLVRVEVLARPEDRERIVRFAERLLTAARREGADGPNGDL
jgi:hypothetical protein